MKNVLTIKKITCLLFIGIHSYCPKAQENFPVISSTIHDSAITIASSHYQPHSFFRRLLMGSNYRKEWSMPVTVPVFHLSHSGFIIKELGGGMQTKSLHLVDSLGKEWALRTVDKNVREALPPFLRNTVAERASQDLISAAFPYGAPIAGELANALGLATARPQIFYVENDTALGAFNSIFAGMLCSLEERDPGFDSTENSIAILENISKNHRYKIQQKVFLKARLLDMLIADWDRHADNWRWGMKDSAGVHFYYAIPRDRDWAFYESGGLLPKLMQLTGSMRHLISFKEKPANIKNLSWKAWMLDKTFLNELTAEDWNAAIAELQQSLTDNVIELAVKKMPSAVFSIDGSSFSKKLKARRDGLQREALKYFKFLSEEIIINGTASDEKFFIHSANDSLIITVYESSGEKKMYERAFTASETYFITINGLAGMDSFIIDENVFSKIRLKINGGEGSDNYDVKGHIKVKIYDKGSKDSVITNKGKAKFYF